MPFEQVVAYLEQWGKADSIQIFDSSTATVALAAQVVGVEPARIAKTMAIMVNHRCIVIVAAGDARLDNKLFKVAFDGKCKMCSPDETLKYTGHPVGGVCPFALPGTINVFLDESLKRFSTVFPACGSPNTAIELTLDELMNISGAKGWVKVFSIM